MDQVIEQVEQQVVELSLAELAQIAGGIGAAVLG